MIPSGSTRLAAVIGSPVRHSLSPALHNAAFAALGLDWVYVAFDVHPGRAAHALIGVRALGIDGLSVTMPHKQDVAHAVDVLDEAAGALDAVNTVVPLEDGRLAGHNTDGAGFVDSLRESGLEPAGLAVVVLGAGGAARAVVDAVVRAGGEVVVVNRSHAAAERAAALGGARARVGSHADVPGADLVVNATSVGMGTSELVLDPSVLRPHQVVADLVYHPLDTALLQAARAAGCRTIDGLGMLVHQAARQQQLFHGHEPPVVVMRAAAEAELARRAG